MARNGVLPVSGGSLDQAYSFMVALDYAWAQENMCKRMLKIVS